MMPHYKMNSLFVQHVLSWLCAIINIMCATLSNIKKNNGLYSVLLKWLIRLESAIFDNSSLLQKSSGV